jgi:putative MATE family efflux protein
MELSVTSSETSSSAVAAGSVAQDTELVPETPRAIHGLQRRVLGLAAPVIGENLLQTLLGVVDTMLVAGLGVAALAGVGSALQVIYVIIAALSALSVGASVLVAQAVGGGNFLAANRFARQALLWSVLMSVPIALVGWACTPLIIGLFGLEPDVALIAQQYLQVTMGTITAVMLLLIGGGVLRGAGDSRTPMLITALANVLNVGLSYALIYGGMGLPALGAVGSAWATFLARLIGAVLLVGVLIRGRNGVADRRRASMATAAGRCAQHSTHRGACRLEEVIVIGGFVTLTPIVAALGTAVLAGHRVVINVLSLSFLPGIGFGLAATALVGQSIGAARRDEAHAITMIALRWAIIWMGALGGIFLLFAPQLMQLFTTDQAMIAAGAAGIRVVAIAQPLWAATFVYAGALRGTGNTRLPLIITSIAIWAAVALSYLALQLGFNSLAVVWATFLLVGPFETFAFWWVWRWWRRAHS